MYDVFRTRYEFSCPERGEARVALSSFRRIEELPGAAHPAVYEVSFDCGCGGRHPGDLAARKIQGGEWPWSFFCYPEERPRPVFPSAFRLLAPGSSSGSVGLAVRCPVCHSVSVNLVSADHVDLPFHNDVEIGVVEHVFPADAERAVEEFSDELYSARFDARRLSL